MREWTETEFLGELGRLTVPEDADQEWRNNAAKLVEEAHTLPLRRFTRWPSIGNSMVVGNADYIPHLLKKLKHGPNWHSRWRRAIRETRVGAPKLYSWLLFASGNSIHHAHHFYAFEAATGSRIEDYDAIFEFGGGYGSLARIARRMGFKGEYTILDLPHFSALQRYYLNACNVHPAVRLTTSFDEFRTGLRNAKWPLFIAMWSLSETPLPTRGRIVSALPKNATVLLGFQRSFGGIDNEAWIARLADGLEPSFSTKTADIPGLNPDSGRLFFASKNRHQPGV